MKEPVQYPAAGAGASASACPPYCSDQAPLLVICKIMLATPAIARSQSCNASAPSGPAACPALTHTLHGPRQSGICSDGPHLWSATARPRGAACRGPPTAPGSPARRCSPRRSLLIAQMSRCWTPRRSWPSGPSAPDPRIGDVRPALDRQGSVNLLQRRLLSLLCCPSQHRPVASSRSARAACSHHLAPQAVMRWRAVWQRLWPQLGFADGPAGRPDG